MGRDLSPNHLCPYLQGVFLGFRYFFLRFAVQKWVMIPIEDLADVALAIEDTDEDEENEEEDEDEEDEGCANL